MKANMETVSVRFTTYRRELIEKRAKELGINLSDIFRYAGSAIFVLFADDTPESAQKRIRESLEKEVLDQMLHDQITQRKKNSFVDNAIDKYKGDK